MNEKDTDGKTNWLMSDEWIGGTFRWKLVLNDNQNEVLNDSTNEPWIALHVGEFKI